MWIDQLVPKVVKAENWGLFKRNVGCCTIINTEMAMIPSSTKLTGQNLLLLKAVRFYVGSHSSGYQIVCKT